MSDIAALTARIEKLEHELAMQQDIHQIRRCATERIALHRRDAAFAC